MKSITFQISDKELHDLIQAYKTLQKFLGKIISSNELHIDNVLEDLKDGLTAKNRASEPRESLESVKKRLMRKGKLSD